MTNLQQMAEGQNNAHIVSNENFETVSAVAVFGKNPATTIGLVWGYYGGLYVGNTVANGTVTLTNNADNYIVVLRSTGGVSCSTSSTNSTDVLYAALYKVTTVSGIVTAIADLRMDHNGLLINALTDADLTDIIAAARLVPRSTGTFETGKCLALSSGATVPTLAVGSAVSLYNTTGSPITLTPDSGMSMRLAGTTDTGARTLAGYGMCTLWWNTTTEVISMGAGLS